MLSFLYCFCMLDVLYALGFPVGIMVGCTAFVLSPALGLGVTDLDFVSTKSHLRYF